MSSRNWCFTTFNMEWVFGGLNHNIKYLVYQKETTQDGRPHFQGYVELTKTARMKGTKTMLGDPGMHLEERKGTREQARDYCMKQESRLEGPWEFGNFLEGQGTRTDLKAVGNMLKNGARITEIVQEHTETFIKYHSGIEKAKLYLSKKRDWKTEVYIFWGVSGAGKTHKVYADNQDIYKKPPGDKWWDGYDEHEVVLIDDYNESYIGFDELLQLMDKYPHKVPVKGGYKEFLAKKIYITSNRNPDEWYPVSGEKKEAFDRRIKEKTEFTVKWADP